MAKSWAKQTEEHNMTTTKRPLPVARMNAKARRFEGTEGKKTCAYLNGTKDHLTYSSRIGVGVTSAGPSPTLSQETTQETSPPGGWRRYHPEM